MMPTTRRFLIPDLEGEITTAVRVIEEVLLWFAHRHPDETVEDYEALPAPLRVGGEAFSDLGRAIGSARFGDLYAPDGRFQLVPLAVVEVPAEVLHGVAAAVAELAHIPAGSADEEVVEWVTDYAAGLSVGLGEQPRTAAWVVELAARIHGVCDLEWGEDQQLVADAIKPGDRQTLTVTQEAAYQRMVRRFLAMWHDYDHLAAFLYRGIQ